MDPATISFDRSAFVHGLGIISVVRTFAMNIWLERFEYGDRGLFGKDGHVVDAT